MKALKALLISAALIGALAACGDDDGDSSSPDDSPDAAAPSDLELSGRTFVSDSVTVDGEPYPLVDGTTLALGFQDDAIQGNAGCNQMVGQGSYADGTLDVGAGLATTQMACDPSEKMDQEQWYGEILASMPSLELDGDQLVLTAGDTVITYTEQAAPTSTPLTGTLWTLESMGTVSSDGADGSMSSVPPGVTSTLEISEAGKIALKPGCNTGNGQAQIEDSVMTVGPIALTRMLCDDAANQVEQTVTAVLDGEVEYAIDGSQLTLTKGEQTLVYQADAG